MRTPHEAALVARVCSVILNSADGSTWTPIYSTTTGTGGTQTLNVTGTGRHIRMYGTARATQYGYSLWDSRFTAPDGARHPRLSAFSQPILSYWSVDLMPTVSCS